MPAKLFLRRDKSSLVLSYKNYTFGIFNCTLMCRCGTCKKKIKHVTRLSKILKR